MMCLTRERGWRLSETRYTRAPSARSTQELINQKRTDKAEKGESSPHGAVEILKSPQGSSTSDRQ